MTKVCSKCKEIKSLDSFYKCSTCKDGLRGACIDCVSMQKKEKWESKTKEEKEAHFLKSKEWAKNNPEMVKEYTKRVNNSEERKMYMKQYYQENKEKIQEYKRGYYKNRTDFYREKFKEYRKTDTYKISLRASIHNNRGLKKGSLTTGQLKDKLKEQNEKCYYCNCELNVLKKHSTHIDHKIPISKGGLSVIENIVWSCAECNMKKGVGVA